MGKSATTYKLVGRLDDVVHTSELGSFELLPVRKRPYRITHYERISLPQNFSQYVLAAMGMQVSEEFEAVGHQIGLQPARCVTPFLPREAQTSLLLYQHSGDVKIRTGNSFERSKADNTYLLAEGEIGLITGDGRRAIENESDRDTQTVLCEIAVDYLQLSSPSTAIEDRVA